MTILRTKPNFKFSTTQSIYDSYVCARDLLVFKNKAYLYQGTAKVGLITKHYYRCDAEIHNLVIHLKDDKVYLVEGIYSVHPLEVPL